MDIVLEKFDQKAPYNVFHEKRRPVYYWCAYLSKNVSTIVKIVHSSTDNDVGDYTPPKKFSSCFSNNTLAFMGFFMKVKYVVSPSRAHTHILGKRKTNFGSLEFLNLCLLSHHIIFFFPQNFSKNVTILLHRDTLKFGFVHIFCFHHRLVRCFFSNKTCSSVVICDLPIQ